MRTGMFGMYGCNDVAKLDDRFLSSVGRLWWGGVGADRPPKPRCRPGHKSAPRLGDRDRGADPTGGFSTKGQSQMMRFLLGTTDANGDSLLTRALRDAIGAALWSSPQTAVGSRRQRGR